MEVYTSTFGLLTDLLIFTHIALESHLKPVPGFLLFFKSICSGVFKSIYLWSGDPVLKRKCEEVKPEDIRHEKNK